MIMEICNNNFIIVIYSCKMGICNKDGKKYVMILCNNKNDYNIIGVTKFNILI